MKMYISKIASAPYAIFLALLHSENEGHASLTKKDIIERAQQYTKTKMVNRNCPYSGWNSMERLIKNGLVQRRSRLATFSLTEKGRLVAGNFVVEEKGALSNQNFSERNDNTAGSTSSTRVIATSAGASEAQDQVKHKSSIPSVDLTE